MQSYSMCRFVSGFLNLPPEACSPFLPRLENNSALTLYHLLLPFLALLSSSSRNPAALLQPPCPFRFSQPLLTRYIISLTLGLAVF